jgi:hypothetical protein
MMKHQSFEFRSRLAIICRLLLCAFTLLIISARVYAIPLSDYHRNLLRAINALDTFEQTDEDESAEDYQRRVAETANGVRNAVPEKQAVESGQFICTVDNTWLHKKLDEFEAASDSDRIHMRGQLIERLKSIEERVNEFEKAKAVNGLSKTEANQKLANILSRSEYESKGRQSAFLFRLLERFIRWLTSFFPQRSPLSASHGSPLTVIAQIVVVALAAAVIVYVLLKLISRLGKRSRKTTTKKKREPRIVLGERLDPEESATDLLAEAEALARNGEIRAAIRKTYIALLVELGDRKIISLAQHKTNRDYLRAVAHVPSLYTNMGGLTDSFERHWYGFAQTSSADWQNFRAAYFAALRSTD